MVKRLSTWGHPGVNLGSTWGQPGANLENLGSTLGQSAPPYLGAKVRRPDVPERAEAALLLVATQVKI